MSSQTMSDEKTNVKRPQIHDEDILKKAIDSLLPEILNWLNAGGGAPIDKDDEEEISEIRDQVYYGIESETPFFDAYKICKNIDDRYMWEADAELVNVMEGVWNSVDKEYRLRVKSWVADNAIKPKFEIGNIVKFKPDVWKKDNILDGEITNLNVDRGEYTVFCESMGHVKKGIGTHGRIFKFEEIEELNDQA